MAEQEADPAMEEVLDYNEGEQLAEQGPEQVEAAADAGNAAQAPADAGQAAASGAPAEQAAAQVKPADEEPAKDAATKSLDPMAQPPHGTEVYMANLAMDATDDHIRDFCEKMGQVYQLRIPKNPDGRNRGYGFVVYSTKAAAENAVQHLNAQELPDFPGRKVRVNESQVKNRLYMGNLPRSMTQHQLEVALKEELQGVEDVELMMDKENPEVNRGFGFITFYNYACAEAARRKYTENERTLGGRPLTVTWAEPKKEEDTSKVKAIYVGNLPETVTEEKLRDLFKAYGEVEKVMLPYSKEDPTKYRDYGFVHFRERPSALQAIARAEEDKPAVDGKELSVALAKPQHDVTQGSYGHGTGGYGRGYGAAAGGYGGYGAAAGGGYGSYGYGAAGGRGRGAGAGYGRGAGAAGGRGYGAAAGRGRGGYGAPAYAGGYEEEAYGEEEEYGDDGYGAGGYGAAAGYGTAAAGVASGGTMMVPVQLPTGQVGYMVVPAGAAVGGAGGPVRRMAAAGYSAAGYGAAAGYAAGAAGAYGSGRGTGYGAGRGTGYGRGGSAYRSSPY